MPSVLVVATPDSSREELEICLTYLCDQAKLEARRGFAGIYGARYAALHANIDMLLESWQQAPDAVLGAD